MELFKVPIDGGESVRLSQGYLADNPNLSPDGKLLAAYYREKAGAPLKLIILAPDGGQPQKILDVPETTISSFRWLPDSRSFAFVDEQKGVSNIWMQQIDGGKPKQLTDFTSGQISSFDLSRDGKPTLLSRGETRKDVVLITGFK